MSLSDITPILRAKLIALGVDEATADELLELAKQARLAARLEREHHQARIDQWEDEGGASLPE